MKLYEYQGKELFQKAGIPVPNGRTVHSPEDVDKVSGELTLPIMAKAQVLAGKRGKAGLIQKLDSWDQVKTKVGEWIGLKHGGEKITSVLLEQPVNIVQEIYLAIIIDPTNACPLIMACGEGGMDIEELSAERPEAIVTERVDVFKGLRPFQIRNVVMGIGLRGDVAKAASKVLAGVYKLFMDYDAELVEINPLVVDDQGAVLAADSKFRIDDNAMFRHKEFERGREQFDDDLEYQAHLEGQSYVKLDGDIGLICTGAGLTMTTLDLVKLNGGEPANFLDFGGANYKNAANAIKTCLANPNVKVLLMVTFGLFARADTIAEGVVQAIEELKPKTPIVMAVRGTGEERARELIGQLGIETYPDTESAVQRAVELAKE
jgi:succinyl-CoA synthetase beta subunit